MLCLMEKKQPILLKRYWKDGLLSFIREFKRIQVWKPRNKNVDLLLHLKIWCFQKHAILLNLFKTNYCFVIHDVQPNQMILSSKVYMKKIYTKHYFKMRKK